MRTHHGFLIVICLTLLIAPQLLSQSLAGSAGELAAHAKPARTDQYGDALPDGAVARLGTVRFRPGAAVNRLGFTHDGQRLAVCEAYSHQVQMWSATSGRFLNNLATPKKNILLKTAISANGKRLAATDEDGRVWLWSMDDPGRPPRQLDGSCDRNSPIVFSPDGLTLASASKSADDFSLVLWDVASGKVIAELANARTHIHCIAFSADGKMLITGDRSGHVDVWDVAAKREVKQLQLGGAIWKVQVGPDGRTLWAQICEPHVGLKNPKLLRWDLVSGERLADFGGWPDPAEAFDLSFDGRNLAVGGGETVCLYEADTGKLLHKWSGPGWLVHQLAFSPDRKHLAGAINLSVCVWDIASGKEVLPLAAHRSEPKLVRFLPDGKTILSAADDGRVCQWDAATGKLERDFHVAGKLTPLDLSADGKVLVLGSADGGCVFLDVATGKAFANVQAKGFGAAERAAISPDGKLIALAALTSGKKDTNNIPPAAGQVRYTVRLFNAVTAEELHNFGDSLCFIRSLFFSANGKQLVASGNQHYLFAEGTIPQHINGGTHVWDVATRQKTHKLQDVHWALCCLPDNHTLAAYADNPSNGFALFDLAGGRPPKRLPMPAGAVFIAACANAQQMVYSGRAGTVMLRQVHTGKRLLQLGQAGQRGWIQAVAFSPDANYLVTAASDTTILVWDLQSMLRAKTERVLSKDALASLWFDLGNADENIATGAIDELVENPKAALTFLKQQVKPLAVGDVQRWLADLDSNVFATREKAMRELGRLEFAAAPALERALSNQPPLEVRLRVKKLLREMKEPFPTQLLATWRAMTVLEQIDTPKARAMLEALAKGASQARLTQEAQAALKRLAPAESP